MYVRGFCPGSTRGRGATKSAGRRAEGGRATDLDLGVRGGGRMGRGVERASGPGDGSHHSHRPGRRRDAAGVRPGRPPARRPRRPAVAAGDGGLTIDPSLAVDESKVLRGGLDTRDDAPRGLFTLAVTLDTGKAFGLHGGTVYGQLNDRFGVRASAHPRGGRAELRPRHRRGQAVQLTQLYYRQTFLDGDPLVFKVGETTPTPTSTCWRTRRSSSTAAGVGTRRSGCCRRTRTRPRGWTC